MPRRRNAPKPRSRAVETPEPRTAATAGGDSNSRQPLSEARLALLVVPLLAAQWALAVISLLQENPTVDEVVHLPAGVSYWERGTFKLYPHNPPLIKLLASWPIVRAGPVTDPLYREPAWGWAGANKAAFAHGFMLLNADRLFELFAPSRLLMPTFAVLGGLVVFSWSRQLFGPAGGLLSLTLWTFCPNILAHCRLVTTDIPATAIGFAATYAFWLYLRRPTWPRALLAGALLGLAQLTKFSLLLLYGLWPLLWFVDEWTRRGWIGRWHRLGRSVAQGLGMVALSVALINIGYGFEGAGKPLGSFSFTSDLLTVDRQRPTLATRGPGQQGPELRAGVLQYRVNRFRGTPMESFPVPLPEYYVAGFDDQKLEAEGVPARALMFADDPRADDSGARDIVGYPVYLNGELKAESWWYYYLLTLVYKVPEGTWALVALAFAAAVGTRRARLALADEAAIGVVPLVVVLVMSLGTNIAIGLRYVLPIFPYVFVSAGRLAPWASSMTRRSRSIAIAAIAAGLVATAAAALTIQPHYLAYFNWASGGPRRGSEHLIDSNLDWGQDLGNLRAWLNAQAPGERVGIAYFGQINPDVFNLRERPAEALLTPLPIGASRPGLDPMLDWFLPPALPGSLPGREDGPPPPGLYAVSVSLVRGLPWRVYEPGRWAPVSAGRGAFSYFERLEPIAEVGHSIFLYRIDARDAARLARFWRDAPVATTSPGASPTAR